MTTFFLKSSNKKLPIIEALEMMLSKDDSIIEVKDYAIISQ